MWDVLLSLGYALVIGLAVLGVLVIGNYARLQFLLWKRRG